MFDFLSRQTGIFPNYVWIEIIGVVIIAILFLFAMKVLDAIVALGNQEPRTRLNQRKTND